MGVVYRKKKKYNPYSHLNIILIVILCIGVILVASFLIMQYNDGKKSSMLDKDFQKQIEAALEEEEEKSNIVQVNNGSNKNKSNSVYDEDFGFKLTKEMKAVVAKATKKASMSYFDDALFIGDSISEGLKLYGILPSKIVLANQSVGLHQIAADKEVYNTPKGKVSLNTALKGRNPKKIYVLLGTNGIPGFSNNDQMKFYNKVVDELLKKFPKATFYIQSLTPVSASRNKTDKIVNNEKINDMNKKVMDMVVEKRKDFKNIYYLNVASSIKTKNGNLDTKVAGSDGLHFKATGHKKMLNYYRAHAVEVK